jgi:hypothetical protein
VKATREQQENMALNPATYSTRSISLLMLAAFAGVALWMFAPWGGQGGGSGSGGGTDASAGLPPSLKVDGVAEAESHNGVVTRLVVPLAVRGDSGIALGDDEGGMRAETAMSDSASAAVPVSYDLEWLDGNGDQVLDPGEHAVLTVELPSASTIHPENPLRLVLRTATGGTLVIEDVLGN